MRILNYFSTTAEKKVALVISTLGLFALLLFIPGIISSSAYSAEVTPAPPSIGDAVPLTYFGPPHHWFNLNCQVHISC